LPGCGDCCEQAITPISVREIHLTVGGLCHGDLSTAAAKGNELSRLPRFRK
jgi:hypothetical protein